MNDVFERRVTGYSPKMLDYSLVVELYKVFEVLPKYLLCRWLVYENPWISMFVMGDDNWKPVKTGDDISVFVTVSVTVINFRQMPELGLNAFHGSV